MFDSGPIVAIAMLLLFFSMPSLKDGRSNTERIRSLDSIGGVLSVCWPIPLIFALQEAGVSHPWSSGIIIGTLVTGIVLLILFGIHESWVTYKTKGDAIFPVHFLRSPPMGLLLL
jgi:fucose permease